jgi:two-component system sensor histidine kinase UhpB
MDLAQGFVAATVRNLAIEGKLDELDKQLPQQLKHLRHVRILYLDRYGHFTELAPEPRENWLALSEQAPGWFAYLVRPRLTGPAIRVVSNRGMNPIIIVAEPADEIAEAWDDFSAFVIVWLVLEALILVMLYLVLGKVLRPLASLSRGMANLEGGDYATRLQVPKVQELAVITSHFNKLASALDVAQQENSDLYRQLISVQESERRQIANELHDEAGPCLFGITANASSIKTLVDQPSKRAAGEIARRVGEILSISERLKQLNRSIIKRLRPGPLGQVQLSDLLDELISSLQRSHPETEITATLGPLGKSYGEPFDLTVYRCIQEGITNAIRHGHAAHILIDLRETGEGASAAGQPDRARRKPVTEPGAKLSPQSVLRLSLRDDGAGMDPATPKGFGLNTMQERVLSLDGCFEIESSSAGTVLRIELPVLAAAKQLAAPQTELAGGVA